MAQPDLSVLSQPTVTSTPGGFWIRFVAILIDGLIALIATLPIQIVFQVMVFKQRQAGGLTWGSALGIAAMYILTIAVQTFYFGWFYKNKGGTPGKLLFGLRVVDIQTGSNISYGKTFLRQFVGMLVNLLTLYIGFIMAGVRKDKRGLHDMIAGTQVIRIARA